MRTAIDLRQANERGGKFGMVMGPMHSYFGLDTHHFHSHLHTQSAPASLSSAIESPAESPGASEASSYTSNALGQYFHIPMAGKRFELFGVVFKASYWTLTL